MPIIKRKEDIEKVRISCKIAGQSLVELYDFIKEGRTLSEIDKHVEKFIRKSNAYPAFLGFRGYKYSACTSVNEIVIHGLPTDYALKEGDIVGVDVGVEKDGFFGDTAYTFTVGKVSPEVFNLVKVTQESLYKGIEVAVIGNRTSDIGYAVQSYVEKYGYGVVREYVGHGIGETVWEVPPVPNYGKIKSGQTLYEGMIIAIEPMINLGKKEVEVLQDKWSVRTKDKKPSAHFEHTICITKDGPEILTLGNTYNFIKD